MADEVKTRTGPLTELQRNLLREVMAGRSHAEAGARYGKSKTHTSNIISAAVAKMGCRKTVQAVSHYATYLAYLEAAELLENSQVRQPVDMTEEHMNHVLVSLAGILRARAARLLPS